MTRASYHFLFSALLTLVLLVGCSGTSPARTPTSSPEASSTLSASPSPSETPAPSPTPLPPLVLLAVPPNAEPALVSELQNTLEGLTSQAGLRFEIRENLTPEEISQDVRLVVSTLPDPGLVEIASATPQVQFVGIGIPGLQPSSNLSVIGPEGWRPDQQGFLAGYLAAVITPDWRVGAITSSDSPQGRAGRQGFVNGAIYFCGLCRPSKPPFQAYPQFVEISPGGSPADHQAAADVLLSQFVKTVYISPGVSSPELLEYLSQAGVRLISGEIPPRSSLPGWVASVRPDPSQGLADLWPALEAGESGTLRALPFTISQVNSELLSPGRQKLVESMVDQLLQGRVDTGVDPLTGEPR